jgi:hypothetical protein
LFDTSLNNTVTLANARVYAFLPLSRGFSSGSKGVDTRIRDHDEVIEGQCLGNLESLAFAANTMASFAASASIRFAAQAQ